MLHKVLFQEKSVLVLMAEAPRRGTRAIKVRREAGFAYDSESAKFLLTSNDSRRQILCGSSQDSEKSILTNSQKSDEGDIKTLSWPVFNVLPEYLISGPCHFPENTSGKWQATCN